MLVLKHWGVGEKTMVGMFVTCDMVHHVPDLLDPRSACILFAGIVCVDRALWRLLPYILLSAGAAEYPSLRD
jgi:hypothetical protein